MFIPNCRYCGSPAILTDSSEIGEAGRHRYCYVCSNYPVCNAKVGCHPGTTIPVGFLANRALRRLRRIVHEKIDPLWQSGNMTRRQVYKCLCDALGLTDEEGHVGMLDDDQCMVILHTCETWKAVETSDSCGPTFGTDRIRRKRLINKHKHKRYDRWKCS